MIIKIPNTQIAGYWEVIKYAAIKADGVQEKAQKAYLIDLLFDLMNNKAFCLISFGAEREIYRVLIGSFYQNDIQNKKIMYIRTLYSFKESGKDAWIEESKKIFDWAKREGCGVIELTTANNLIAQLISRLGFKENYRKFSLELGG